MKEAVAAATSPGGLLLVGLGSRQDLTLLTSLAGRLADAERLTLEEVVDPGNPDASLAALGCAAGRSDWLAALPLDPGLPLVRGGRWAEALGAWRQPCLLVLSEAQMDTGLPAAGTALLEHWRVPLVGLLQLGGAWKPQERRRDGLPWLGWLPTSPDGDPEALAALQPVLRLRRRALQAA